MLPPRSSRIAVLTRSFSNRSVRRPHNLKSREALHPINLLSLGLDDSLFDLRLSPGDAFCLNYRDLDSIV